MNLEVLSKIIREIPKEAVETLHQLISDHSEIFLIGNGGSNAIASHMGIDYAKFLDKRCFIPDSGGLLTMMVNDYGKADMYARFIDYYKNPNQQQLVILISSSGNSLNIITAAHKCISLGMPLVILTGFKSDNRLNSISSPLIKLKYWVDSESYGEVEMAHHIFLHSIV